MPERRALAYLRDVGLPCVLVDRMPDPAFDQVGVNNREAMRNLVERVAALGHRRIGYVGGNPALRPRSSALPAIAMAWPAPAA